MRWLMLVAIATGCTFDPPGGDDGLDPDEQLVTIVDDSAEELANPAELDEGLVTPTGTIEPHAYVLGGLHARAYQTTLVTPISTWTTLEQAIAAAPATKRGSGYSQIPQDWMFTRPAALGLDSSDSFTVIYEGEIALAVGDNILTIDSDDESFFEVDTGAGFEHLVRDTAPPGAATVMINVARAGWYPIRGAVSEGAGTARLVIKLAGVALAPGQLRTKVTADPGLLVYGYDLLHTGLHGTTAVASVDSAFGMVAPLYDLGLGTTYDLRFAGQIYIDTAGTWSLAATPTSVLDTMRLWIDGHRVASQYAGGFDEGLAPVATLDLTVGWHDLAVDLSASQGTPQRPSPHNAGITFTATPPGGTAMPVASSSLRPAVAGTIATAVIGATTALLDAPNTTNVSLPVPAVAGATIDVVDAGYFLFHADAASYTVALDTGAASVMLPSADFGSLFNSELLAGQPVPTTPWTMRFTDTVAGGSQSDPFAFFVFADVATHGGTAMPFAPEVTYVSSPHETPGALRLGAVRVRSELDGAMQRISIRTAASAAELDAATWVDVASGEIPDVAANAVVQYRVVVTGDGWQYPVIDAMELDYVIAQ